MLDRSPIATRLRAAPLLLALSCGVLSPALLAQVAAPQTSTPGAKSTPPKSTSPLTPAAAKPGVTPAAGSSKALTSPASAAAPTSLHVKDGGGGASRGTGPRLDAARHGAAASGLLALSAERDLWWRWWELSRLPLLLPEPVARGPGELSPDGRYADPTPLLAPADADRARARLLPLLLAACGHEDSDVRAAAATAAGRIGGAPGVPVLRGLLGDRVLAVRESALLALGATGTGQAAPFLLDLASRTSLAGEERLRGISPDVHALAWVALGLGRARGFSDGIGSVMADLAGELQDERLRDLAPATLLYQRLSPADAFDLVGLARLGDAQALPEVRERSAEALGALADPSMIPSLHAALHDGDLRLRRSAALALGSFRGGALLDVLARQLAAEQDELLRGYLLLAIANQQAAPAAALLTDTLARGDALVRPWAALALGLLARREADVSQPARATLRLEAARSHAVTDRLAFALAGGLARDEARAEDFAQMLADSADAHVRLVAAEALTLLGAGARDGWPGSVELRLALKAQLADEADPGARGVLAEALAVHRDARDVSALLAALCAVHAGEPVADLARGCGAHRTRDMLSGLSALVADVSLKAPVRAAAWQSLGLLLDPQWSSRLPGALAGAQLDALPDWCSRLLDQSTL